MCLCMCACMSVCSFVQMCPLVCVCVFFFFICAPVCCPYVCFNQVPLRFCKESMCATCTFVCFCFQARQQAQMRHQMASDSKSDYSAYLQKFNQEQNEHYYTVIPNIFQVNITAPHRDTCYTELKKLSNYRKYSILIDRCPSILELLLQYSTKQYNIAQYRYHIQHSR